MRYKRRREAAGPVTSFNFTPLIDVIFTLTIFYMLVTQFSSAELVPLRLPEPQDSRAVAAKIPDRVVVNCRLGDPAEGGGVLYSLGPNIPESIAVISDRLAAMKAQQPELKLLIRADKRLAYADVRVIMRTAGELGIELLNVAAHMSEAD